MGQRYNVNHGIWNLNSRQWMHIRYHHQSHVTQPGFSQIFKNNKHIWHLTPCNTSAWGRRWVVPTHPYTSLLLTTYPDTTAVHLTKLDSALQGGRIGHCYLEKCFECYSRIISQCHCQVFLWDDDHDPRKQLVTSILQLTTGNYCDTFVFTEMIALQYLDIILIYTKPSLPMINYRIL